MSGGEPAVSRTPRPARSPLRLRPSSQRVLARPFLPGEWAAVRGPSRLRVVLDRVLGLPDADVDALLDDAVAAFDGRHRDLGGLLRRRAEEVLGLTGHTPDLSPDRTRLIGAYFTSEYALEAAALTNPSMVPHPDGTPGRFVLSLRAIGEGHISSITFRTGTVAPDGTVTVDEASPHVTTGERRPPLYERALFIVKLDEMGADPDLVELVMNGVGERFTLAELEAAIARVYERGVTEAVLHETVRMAHWLASSNYVVAFDEDTAVSERVIFPSGPVESAGMEDARFVRFTDGAHGPTYYATYTAYDGFEILPQLIETRDFVEFRVATLNGRAAQNKGIALFPRKIDGRYVALGRQDRESISLMTTDNVRFWQDHETLYRPSMPWELIQTGNCGSPIETDEGWLVLTHGVGPLRSYALGAILLDLEDPSTVLGVLAEPILEPADDERDGYVPNVVYSCGAMVVDHTLVVPYGFSDVGTRFACYDLDALLSALVASPPSTRA